MTSLGPFTRVISGGQTGADRAALDWAMANGVPVGGWCPRGRKAEDGPIPDRYPLRETPSDRYQERTLWNARDSHATVIITTGPARTGGTSLTAMFLQDLGRPWTHVHSDPEQAGRDLAAFLRECRAVYPAHIRNLVLNVAGPRLSKDPTIVEQVHAVLDAARRVAS